MKKSIRNMRGFTLVEVIVIVLVIALMGVIAVSMYFSATSSLSFFATFKSVQSTLRQARSFAITNSSISALPPDRYGVYIDYDSRENFYSVFMFADDGFENPYVYKDDDTIYAPKNYKIDAEEYELTISSPIERDLTFPVAFYYELGSGDFQGMYSTIINPGATEPVFKKSTNNIVIQIKQTSGKELSRFLVINQVSGLAEEYLNL